MDEFLNFGRHIGTCCWEDIRFDKSHGLAHKAQDSLVNNLIFQCQWQWRTLGMTEIFNIVLAAHRQRIGKHLFLHSTRAVNLILDSLVYFLPKPRHRRHTCGVCLPHRVLYLLGIGIDDYLGTLRQTQICPSTLKDMRERQERDGTVALTNRHTLVIGLECGLVLPIREHDALGVARGPTGI